MDRPPLKCIIIDDEPAAIRILENYCNKHGGIVVLETYRNPIDALNYLRSNSIHFIFLDINMPELNGMDLLESLNPRPKTILTTAYSEYALESYEYDVVDYLLKPIRFPRFIKAINKIHTPQTLPKDKNSVIGKIAIKDGNTIYQIHPLEIVYIEAMGNYIKIHKANGSILLNSGLQEFLDHHHWQHLIRVHKSYAVNINCITKFTYYHLFLNQQKIPIGRTYRMALRNAMNLKS